MTTQTNHDTSITHTTDQLKTLADHALDALPHKNRYAKRVRIPRQVIFAAIEEAYGLYSTLEIAVSLGLARRTIQKYIELWKGGPSYDAWLDKEWTRLHRSDTVPDIEKYRALTALKKQRMMTATINNAGVSGSLVLKWSSDPGPVLPKADSST